MKMIGHNTQSIYQRYAIADESMLKDAAIKLAGLHAQDLKEKKNSHRLEVGKKWESGEAKWSLVERVEIEGCLIPKGLNVARDGIEPPTRGFSVRFCPKDHVFLSGVSESFRAFTLSAFRSKLHIATDDAE
jgi:hypothetical protein